MGPQKTDVLIIGGGIAGLTISKYLAEERIDFILVEDHTDFFMKSCGECITYSMAGYEFYEIYESKVGIERTTNIILRIKHGKISVPVTNILVDKKKIENELARQAEKKGAIILMNERVSRIERKERKLVAFPQGIEAKLIVGADGISSIVRRYTAQEMPRYGIASSGILEEKPEEQDRCIVDFSKKTAPYGYAWWFPKEKNWNIGIGTTRKKYFKDCLSKFKEKYPTVMRWRTGIVPLSKPLKSYDKNIILVGDSASQVVAPTATGILPAMICAKIGAETLVKFSKSNFENVDTSLYEKAWKLKIGKIFDDCYLFNKIYMRIYFSEYLTHQFLRLVGKLYKE